MWLLILSLLCVLIVIVVLIVNSIRHRIRRNERIVLKGDEYILITGCDSGIGHAVATHLQMKEGKSGFHVIASCLRPDSTSSNKLRESGVKVLPLDFTKDDVKKFCDKVDDIVGPSRLHAVINNAGVCIMGEFDWLTQEQVDNMFLVNLSSMRIVKGLMDRIIKDKSRIINVSSVNGQISFPGLAIYCASKYALEAFTDAISMELSRFGVRVIKFRLGDFVGMTGILSAQLRHAEEMWSSFSAAQRSRYGDYFYDYHRAVASQCGRRSVRSFDELLKCFEKAVMAVWPTSLYTAGNLVLPLRMLTFMPESPRNRLVAWVFEKGVRKQGVKYPPRRSFTSHTKIN